jgi:hypothetical protein
MKAINWERSRTPVMAACAGLLIILLMISIEACSKKETVTSNNKPVESVQPVSAPITQTATPMQTASSEPVKKPVRKHPVKAAYTNKTYGVSLQYPWQYAILTGERAKLDSDVPVGMNFVQPGGVTLATVQMPNGFYPNTDLAYGFFTVNVNKSIGADDCGKFASVDQNEDGPLAPSKVTVHNLEFLEAEQNADQGAGRYYHLYQNGACYEFALGVATAEGDVPKVTPVDREKVMSKLEGILETVQIGSGPEIKTEVAQEKSTSGTTQTGDVQKQ